MPKIEVTTNKGEKVKVSYSVRKDGYAVIVSELLRHTDVAFTEKIYIDIIKKYRQKVFEEFEI